MKIYEYLLRKHLYGGGLNQMEEQVVRCLAENDPKVKEQIKKVVEHFPKTQVIGVAQSVKITFPNNEEMLFGGNYRR